ncbi:hypothetical protein Tco_0152251, partial [Tanacetum coccineum]
MSLCFFENDLSHSFILEVDEISKVAILCGGGDSGGKDGGLSRVKGLLGRWELAGNLVRVRVTGFNFGEST